MSARKKTVLRRLASVLGPISFLVAASANATVPGEVSEAPVNGVWRMEKSGVEVQISPCEQLLCGTIVAMPGATPERAKSIGWKLLTKFDRTAPNEWRGEMHNVNNGQTYACVMSMNGKDQLIVTPYVGAPLFGIKHVLKRISVASST